MPGKGTLMLNAGSNGMKSYPLRRKKVEAIYRLVPMKDFRREKRINYCRFDVPEGRICCYYRHVQTKPNLDERKWFRLDDGQFTELAGNFTGFLFRRNLSKRLLSTGLFLHRKKRMKPLV